MRTDPTSRLLAATIPVRALLSCTLLAGALAVTPNVSWAQAQGIWNLTVTISDNSTPPSDAPLTYEARCFYYLPAPAAPAPDWGYVAGGLFWYRNCGHGLPIGTETSILVEPLQSPYAIRVYPAAFQYYDTAVYTGCVNSPICDNHSAIGLYAQWGSIFGFVSLASDGTPLPNVTVVAYDTNGAKRGEATTDGEGRYEFVRPNATPNDIENHWALQVAYELGYADYRVFAADLDATGPPPDDPLASTTRTFSSTHMGQKDFVIGQPEGDDHDPDEATGDEETPEEEPPQDPPDDKDCRPPCGEGLPVNLRTGSVYLEQSDAVIRGVRRVVDFTRRYNSRMAYDGQGGAFGRGWTHPFEKTITVLGAHRLMRLDAGTGGPAYFQDSDQNGMFAASIPVTGRSRIGSSGSGFSRTFTFGGSESYDAAGQLASQTDRVGNVTTLNRDGAGRITSIVLPGGRALNFEYSGAHVSRMTGPTGTLATYSYSTGGLLQHVEYPSGSGYDFAYDSSGQLLTMTDLTGRVVESHTYANAKALTSAIAGAQNRISFAYDSVGTTVSDSGGRSGRYGVVKAAGLKRVANAVGCPGCGSEERSWTYDARGRLSGRRKTAGGPVFASYSYDANDNSTSVSLPLGRTSSYTYDSEGRLLERTGPDGAHSSWTYGTAGPLTITDPLNHTTTIAYSPVGLVSSVTNSEGETTSFGYNEFGDVVSITDPVSRTTTFGHDGLGRRTSATDPLSHTTTFAYNSRGQLTQVAAPDETHSDFSYDGGGRLANSSDALGRSTHHTYDAFGNLKAVQDPAGGTTRYEYDEMSRLAALTDAEGHTTRFDRDTLGRVSQVTYPNGASESFTFTPLGQLAAKTDRRGLITNYEYDPAERLTRVSYSDATPAKTLTYDAANRPLTAANGTDTLTWTYDAAGQMLSEASARNGTTVSYTYDSAGRRHALSLNGTAIATYEYNPASQLLSLNWGSRVFSFGYDGAGRRASMAYPNGASTSYAYDDLNRLTSVQAMLGAAPIASSAYTYDPIGNRLTKSTDFAESYTYDRLDRLTAVERSGSLTAHSHFSYDYVGNRTSTQVDNAVVSSVHNELNELLSSSAGGPLHVKGVLDEPGTVTVNGNAAQMLPGNLFEATISALPGTNSVAVQATDGSGNVRASTYSVDVAAQPASYDYDANGNLASKTEGPNTWTYEWTAENELTRVTKNSAEQARYSYDPLGRRVARVVAGMTTGYTYDADDIVRELQGSSSLKYVHGPTTDEPLARDDGSGALTYYHADGLGSIVKRTSEAGAVTHEYRYDAWGNIELGASVQGHAFTGREWDPETGLYYHRARYHDPKVGRFISEDPIGFAGGINFYAYVGGNPVLFVDPFGLVEINLFKKNPLRTAADELVSPAGVFTVAGHGNPSVMLDEYTKKRLSPLELAERIRKAKEWREGRDDKVWLLGCNTGTGKNSFAQQLADELAVPVVAATGGKVWYDPRSTSQYGPFQPSPEEGGGWKTFQPRPAP